MLRLDNTEVKMSVEFQQNHLQKLLDESEVTNHLRVIKRGKALTLVSGPDDNPQKHARLAHLGGQQWGLSFPRHTGRWEKTPFTGTLDDLLDTLTANFPMYLQQF